MTVNRGDVVLVDYPFTTDRGMVRPLWSLCFQILSKVGVIRRFGAWSTFTRVTACRLAESPCDPPVSKAPTVLFRPRVASIATGWSDPVAGWELHPLENNTFHAAHNESDPDDDR